MGWRAAITAWDDIGHRYNGAYARLRFAEAMLDLERTRPPAPEVITALQAGARAAEEMGAIPLRDETVALARRARIEVSQVSPVAPADGRAIVERDDAPPGGSGSVVLTERERDVLRLVALGHTNREIGDQLFISEKTVSVHVSNAMAKLGALSRYEAAATAQRLDLLGP